MPRLLQVNTMGAWKNVQTIRSGEIDSAGDLANVKTAVVLLATATDDAVSFRVIDRLSGAEDRIVASWDRRRGWRRGP